MQITPLIPDGYSGTIKRLTCTLCRRTHYMTLADYEAMQSVSYCHECSSIILTELEKVKDMADRAPTRGKTVRRFQMESTSFTPSTPPYSKASPLTSTPAPIVPRGAVAHCGRGDALLWLERYEEALVAYGEPIRLDHRLATAYSGKADALNMLRRYEEAIAAYEEAIQIGP